MPYIKRRINHPYYPQLEVTGLNECLRIFRAMKHFIYPHVGQFECAEHNTRDNLIEAISCYTEMRS